MRRSREEASGARAAPRTPLRIKKGEYDEQAVFKSTPGLNEMITGLLVQNPEERLGVKGNASRAHRVTCHRVTCRRVR